jgi:tetratricopeptide (TPR) repeat protein
MLESHLCKKQLLAMPALNLKLLLGRSPVSKACWPLSSYLRLFALGSIVVAGTAFSVMLSVPAPVLASEKYVSDGGHKAPPYVGEIQNLIDTRQYSEAIKRCDRLILANPGSSWPLLCRAKVWHAKSDIARALADSNQSLAGKPLLAEAYVVAAASLYYLNKNNEALIYLKKALAIDPTVPDCYSYLALSLAESGKFDEAVAYLNKAILLDPNDADLYKYRAMFYLEVKQFPKALQDLNTRLKLHPNEIATIRSRANIYDRLGRPKDVLSDLNLILKLEPASYRDLLSRARLLSRLGQHDKALSDCHILIKANPLDDDGYYYRACEYAALHKWKEAIKDYSVAIDESPETARASYEGRAKAYEQLGQLNLAEQDRKKAMAIQGRPAEKHLFEMPKK